METTSSPSRKLAGLELVIGDSGSLETDEFDLFPSTPQPGSLTHPAASNGSTRLQPALVRATTTAPWLAVVADDSMGRHVGEPSSSPRRDLVTLEPLTRDHADELFAAAHPREIWEWWPFNPAVDRRTFDSWVDAALQATAEGTEASFATVWTGPGRVLGSTSFCTLRPEHRGLEIGWTWLTPSAWRTGANAEAKLLQLRHAFDTLDCQRVEFETDECNIRSRRALEAMPATHEGVLRDYTLLPTVAAAAPPCTRFSTGNGRRCAPISKRAFSVHCRVDRDAAGTDADPPMPRLLRNRDIPPRSGPRRS